MIWVHNRAVLEPRVLPAFAITYFYNHCNISPTPMVIHESKWIQWLFFQNLTKRSMTPRWPLTPLLLRSHVWLYPRSLYPSPMKICQSMWIQWPFFQKLEPKVIDPLMTFDSKSVEVTCVTLPKDPCVQVPWKYIKVCGYSDTFFQKLEPKVINY